MLFLLFNIGLWINLVFLVYSFSLLLWIFLRDGALEIEPNWYALMGGGGKRYLKLGRGVGHSEIVNSGVMGAPKHPSKIKCYFSM